MRAPESASAIGRGGVLNVSLYRLSQTDWTASPRIRWLTPLATVSTSGSSGIQSYCRRLKSLLRDSPCLRGTQAVPRPRTLNPLFVWFYEVVFDRRFQILNLSVFNR